MRRREKAMIHSLIRTRIRPRKGEATARRNPPELRFLRFPPPLSEGTKTMQIRPARARSASLTSSKFMHERNKRVLTRVSRGKGFLPRHPGVRVSGTAPEDPGVVSDPIYTSTKYTPLRARPLLTRVARNRKAKGRPGERSRKAAFPKRKCDRAPAVRWQCSL
jgi:hypothetical protein